MRLRHGMKLVIGPALRDGPHNDEDAVRILSRRKDGTWVVKDEHGHTQWGGKSGMDADEMRGLIEHGIYEVAPRGR